MKAAGRSDSRIEQRFPPLQAWSTQSQIGRGTARTPPRDPYLDQMIAGLVNFPPLCMRTFASTCSGTSQFALRSLSHVGILIVE